MKTKFKIIIKQKLTNNTFIDGKKNTSENFFLKIHKELQKYSTKNSTQIIQLALIHSLPILRTNKFSQKKKRHQKIKEIPSFIQNEKTRISRAIKFILLTCKKSKSNYFYIHFKNEVLSSAQFKSSTIEFKNNLQKIGIAKKNILKYYSKK